METYVEVVQDIDRTSYTKLTEKEEPHSDVSNDKGLKSCWKNIFSSAVKTEIRHIFQLGWPTVLSYFFELLLSMQSILFCGSLGKTALAAGSLSITMYNVFGLSAAIGLTSALDTLCAQAFGAKNFRMVGVVLQRGICILSIAMVIVCALWMLTHHFLLLIGMDSELAKMSDTFIIILVPILPACFGVQLLMKYLQTQGIVRPIVVVGLITNIVGLGLNFLIVKGLNQGFEGVAIALVSTFYIQLILMIMYIIIRKAYRKTWKGWSVECLYDWKEFLSLSISGMLMICLEWWSFEISSFLMGKFGESTVAANGVLLQTSTMAFMLPLGISIAASVLVGNYLGANDPKKAKLVTKLSLIMTLICTVVIGITLVTAKKYIAMAFSENESVINLITSTMPLLALFCCVDAFQTVCAGILRGCGRQKLGMVITFISYETIAIPVAIILAFVVGLRLTGMWLGICTGVCLQAFQYLIALVCTNWNRQAKLAVERTQNAHYLDKQENGEDIGLLDKSIKTDDLPNSSNTRVLNRKKLIFLRSIPYIIALLLLCSTICIRLFVPLPAHHGSYGNNTISNQTVSGRRKYHEHPVDVS